MRHALGSLMGSSGAPLAPDEITLSPRAQRVLDISIHRSRQRGGPSAASEDLLLALIDEREHFTSQILRALNIQPEAVRTKLLDLG
jgi:ATP-dependent Clp protease ATP-binding subunit ClpA